MTPAEGRRFAATLGVALSVIGGILIWRGHETAAKVLFGLGALMLTSGVLIPGHLSGVYRAWMGLAHAISKVTNPIVMSVIFFVVFTPVGILRRLFGGNPLKHAKGPVTGYWSVRDPAKSRSDLTRQF